MTETEWPASDDPGRMLYVVQGPEPEWGGFPTRKITDRKLRLFACACCRQVWPLLTDPRSRNAVEFAERYADGEATGKELNDARNWAMAAWHTENNPAGLARYATYNNIALAARRLASREWVNLPPPAMQADLLRCIVGNPFRPVQIRENVPSRWGGYYVFGPHWLAHNGGAVRRLAESIYIDHAFDRLPILADALEEAGCQDVEMLAHLRGPGPHARGCWVVDLLLGKS